MLSLGQREVLSDVMELEGGGGSPPISGDWPAGQPAEPAGVQGGQPGFDLAHTSRSNPVHPQQPSKGGRDRARGEQLPRAKSLRWEPWEGSIIPAWTTELRRGRNGAAFVGVLNLERGGRARLTLRAEQGGAVVATLGHDMCKGIRTPIEAQEWARNALARLYAGMVGVRERTLESDPMPAPCKPAFEPSSHLALASSGAVCHGDSQSEALQDTRPEPDTMRAFRSGRRAGRARAGGMTRSGAPGSERPPQPDRREAGGRAEGAGGSPRLVNHCISARDTMNDGQSFPPDLEEQGQFERVNKAVRSSGGTRGRKAETSGQIEDFAEPATIRFPAEPKLNYTLHILYDVIDIRLMKRRIWGCE